MSRSVRKIVGIGMVGFGTFLSVISGGVAAPLAFKFLIAPGLLLATAKKPKLAPATSLGSQVQLSGDPQGVREVIYGETWTAGTIRFRNATGANNNDFYMVIVLAGHEITSVQQVVANKLTLTLDGSGNVTSPSTLAGIVNVRFYLGTDSQTADSTLTTTFPTHWTSNHRLRGLAYAIVRLTFDEERLNALPEFRFKVRGRKVYDPRLDSTNGGSGAHRLATPSTWAWSENAVLCANDFLRGVKVNGVVVSGLGLDDSRFDWANVIAEANVCDESVSLAAGGNQKRYTSNGVIDPRQSPSDIKRHFELAIAGDIIPSDAKWRFFCGAYRTPTLSLTDQHFVGPLEHNLSRGEADRVDTAQGSYASQAELGSAVDYSPIGLSSADAAVSRIAAIDLQLVNDVTNSAGVYDGGARAQRIAKLLLEKDSAGKTIKCTTSLYGLRAMPGETIFITRASFGLSNQAMRVQEVQLRFQQTENGGYLPLVDLVLEAGPSSLYSWSAAETAIAASPTLPQAQVPMMHSGQWTPILANVTRSGSTFTKTGGTHGSWTDAAFYSQEGYQACFVSFRFSQTDVDVMVGLNSDPAADHNFTSLDFAIYAPGVNTTVQIYENGALIGNFGGAWSTSDQFTITYDGLRVRYYKNATLLRTVALVGARLFVDSSFNDMGAAVNSVAFGPITHVLANAVGWAADSQGKPAGMRGVQGIADRSQLSLDVSGRLKIVATPDNNVGYGFPAIPVDPAKKYQLTIKHRSSGASADGLYLRFWEKNAALAVGKTHVGAGDGESMADVYTTFTDLVANGAMPGSTVVEETFTYTPTAGARFATFGMLNWEPDTLIEYEVEWVALTELGSNVDLLPGVLPPVDTFGLNAEAVDEVAQATDAGPDSVGLSGFSTGTSSIWVAGPTLDIEETSDVVEVTATCRVAVTAVDGATGNGSIQAGYAVPPGTGLTGIGQLIPISSGENTPAAVTGTVSSLTPGSWTFGFFATVTKTGGGGTSNLTTTVTDSTVAVARIKR